MAGNTDELRRRKIFDNVTIAAEQSLDSAVINIANLKLEGNITVQIELTGDGILDMEWLQSNNFEASGSTGDFVRPDNNSIVSSFIKTSGKDLDGKDLLPMPMINSSAFKIRSTNQSTTDSITLTAWLSMQ